MLKLVCSGGQGTSRGRRGRSSARSSRAPSAFWGDRRLDPRVRRVRRCSIVVVLQTEKTSSSSSEEQVPVRQTGEWGTSASPRTSARCGQPSSISTVQRRLNLTQEIRAPGTPKPSGKIDGTCDWPLPGHPSPLCPTRAWGWLNVPGRGLKLR